MQYYKLSNITIMKKLFLFGVTALLLATVGCGDDEKEVKIITTPALTPSSIEQVRHIFELKYGEEYDYTYHGEKMIFSIVDVVDSLLINCSNLEVLDLIHPLSAMKTHVYIQVKFNKETSELIKLSSQECGALKYKINGNDIMEIEDMIKKWGKDNVFKDLFNEKFGKGVSLESNPFNIYIAKSYPQSYKQSDKKLYKFILILTR